MNLTVTVDTKKLEDALRKAPQEVEKTLRVELKQQLQKMQQLARMKSVHRFTTRTGFLERSIQQSVDQSGLFGIVKLVLGIAPYGAYVHEGHHSWKADQFLYRAFELRKEIIIKAINDAVSLAIQRAGLT
jgi:hypothetical protein